MALYVSNVNVLRVTRFTDTVTSEDLLDGFDGSMEAWVCKNNAPLIIGVSEGVFQTSAAHGFTTGDTVLATTMCGIAEDDGEYVVTVIDETHFSLDTLTFSDDDYLGKGKVRSVVHAFTLSPDADGNLFGEMPYNMDIVTDETYVIVTRYNDSESGIYILTERTEKATVKKG